MVQKAVEALRRAGVAALPFDDTVAQDRLNQIALYACRKLGPHFERPVLTFAEAAWKLAWSDPDPCAEALAAYCVELVQLTETYRESLAGLPCFPLGTTYEQRNGIGAFKSWPRHAEERLRKLGFLKGASK